MAQVSVSEAARLAGISRSNFYKNYIRQGKLSVTRDHQDRPQVDTAEVLRVFGRLQDDSNVVSEERQEAKEREQWYRQQIGELTSTLKQLEYTRPAPFWQRWFK